MNQSAEPYSKGIRSRHADKSIRFFHSVNRFFSSIFKPCLAGFMPCCKYNFISRNHANPKTENPVRFAPISTSVRKRGKTPENGIFIETMKSDPYIQIITYRRQWPAIPIPPFSLAKQNTIASDSPQMRFAPGTQYQQRHTRHTIRHDHTPSNPVHYIQRYTLHAAA